MKVMVLGGRGFVGRAVVKLLRERPDVQVVIASRHPGASESGAGGVSCVAVDARDEVSLCAALKGIDAVVNCVTGDGPSIAAGALSLVNAALKAGRPRLVHLSTMSVYGSQQGVLDERAELLDDIGWYGHAKIEAESHIRRYAQEGGLAVALRPGVIIGPGSEPWVRRIARWLQAHRLADLGAQGDGPANLVDVNDVAQAVVLALGMALPADGTMPVFNLAAPDSPRWNDYFCDLTLALGAGPLQRWGARRLKAEIYGRGVPLKVLERVAGKLKLDANQWPQGIPPSLAGLWAQQIQLDVRAATKDLGVQWTPYARTLAQSVQWLQAGSAAIAMA